MPTDENGQRYILAETVQSLFCSCGSIMNLVGSKAGRGYFCSGEDCENSGKVWYPAKVRLYEQPQD
jgi:hypothetical protein